MITHYYLGANTPYGFYSLYDYYTGEDDRLYIIKGSPGCGKSTFMQKLAKAAEENDEEIELIHCSGDPDSLDGVYFPERHIAYVDGTAPHIIEPRYAGVRENYINLGDTLDMDSLEDYTDQVKLLNEKYKAEYKKAYEVLNSARATQIGIYNDFINDGVKEAVIKKAVRLCKKEFRKRKGKGSVKERFTDALTYKGWIHRYDTIAVQTDKVYLVDTAYNLNYLFMEVIAKTVIENNWDVIICRDAIFPEKVSHIIVPQSGIAVVSRYGTEFPDWNMRAIHLDLIPCKHSIRLIRDKIRIRRKIWDTLLNESKEHLIQAKMFHDELEQIYRPYINFDITDSILDKHIEIIKNR